MSAASDHPSNPAPAVQVGVGCAVWHAGRVLLVRRGKPPLEGQWSIPGGRLEPGETTAAGASREVFEETGLRIEILGLVDVVDAIGRGEDGTLTHHFVLVDYAARWIAGEARAADDAAEVRWATPSEADRLVDWDETRRIIAESRRLLPGV